MVSKGVRENEAMERSLLLIMAGLIACGSAGAQGKTQKPESPAKLELTMEVATTDDDGYPSALMITIRNVGDVPVDMPVLKGDCSPDNGFRIETGWTPDKPDGHGYGSGGGCGIGDGPSLQSRIEHAWVRLRPGESMTQTERFNWGGYARGAGSGTVEYWVEYTPPAITEKEATILKQAGYLIPTETLETQHSSFHVR